MPPETEPIQGDIHRLSRFEYQATVTDVLGTAPSTAASVQLTDSVVNGFDNNAEVQPLGERDFEQLYAGAAQLAQSVFASPELRARVVVCADETPACAAQVLQATGLRLFRRPLRDDELGVYTRLYTTLRTLGHAHDSALQQLLVALLSSAQFIYRMEFTLGDVAEPLDGYEQASRLSYLLWSSAPDDALLEAARADALSADGELTSQLERMWNDPKSARFVDSFGGQWLGLPRLAGRLADPMIYPAWNPQVEAAAMREVTDYFDAFVRQDLDVSSLYSGVDHDVDGALAPFYGLTLDPQSGRAHLTGERASYLGSVAFLTLTSTPSRSSPMQRGHFILDQLLCVRLPPPPASVPPVEPETPNLPLRQIYDGIRANPDCAICHKQMDPPGLALEHFDGIGMYRQTYAMGEPIDTLVELEPWAGHPTGKIINGLSGVIERLTSDPEAERCLAENVYTYALSGTQDALDLSNIAAINESWQQGPHNIKELVSRVVLSKTFRFKQRRVSFP